MISNYFKLAFRQIKKQKFYSLINIGGLALGMACCILIALYISHELSYDKHHSKADKIFRVTRDMNMQGINNQNPVTPAPIAKALVENYPEIVKTARLNPYFGAAGTNLVRTEKGTQKNFEEGFVYADQSFFEIFDFDLIEGDEKNLLTEPNMIVITKRIADKYFPYENPVGKTFLLNDDNDFAYKVSGVVENIPSTSHFDYDFWLSMERLDDSRNNNWVNNNYYTYALLAPNANPEALSSKMKELEDKFLALQFKDFLGIDMEEFRASGKYYHFYLHPLTDIHLYSGDMLPQLKPNGDIKNVRLFGVVAILILFIAVFNYMNLSTAQATNRAKEVGVRKVLGSMKADLVRLFLSESILITAIGFVIALLMLDGFTILFERISNISLSVPWNTWWFVPGIFMSIIVIGFLAGLYPSFYLSNFKPIKTLKGELRTGTKSKLMRSTLVVFQFTVSIGLIISTMIIFNQMKFIQNKKLGFEKDQVLLIHDAYTLGNGEFEVLNRQVKTLKNQLKNLPEVQDVSISNYLPAEGFFRNSVNIYPDGEKDQSSLLYAERWVIDHDYINTLGMELVAGRNFSAEMPTDSQAVIINETAARQLGYAEPVGKSIQRSGNTKFPIIGVVKDFHFQSMKENIEPAYFVLGLSTSSIAVKANTSDMKSLISKAENIWDGFAPDQAFRYTFLDERFSQMYEADQRVGKIITSFSILAIIIACLGLFGLAAFIASQKTKEIGIRKVLGASVPNIVALLSKDFLKLVLISLIIATPIAWYVMSNWLNSFVYHVGIQWWVFIIAGFIAVILAFLTISWQAIKAAVANPIKSLRSQ